MGNKKIERALSLMMAFVLLFSLCPVTAFAAETVDVKFIVTAGEEAVAGALISIDETITGIADENGDATIAGLEENQEYTATITAEGYHEETVTFTADGSDVAVELEPIVLVDVTVTVKEGNDPLQDANVAVNDTSINVATDENGEAVLSGLEQNQSYVLTVTKEGYKDSTVPFTASDATVAKGVSVTLTAYEKVTISGTVICEDVAVVGAEVVLHMTDDSTVSAITSETGAFTFENVYKELVKELVITGEEGHYPKTVNADAIDYTQVAKYELTRKTFALTAQVVSDGGTVTVSADEVRYGDTASVEITADTENGQPTHSIYRITDNNDAVASDALGLTSYTYELTEVKAKHDIFVTFVADVEEISFYVGANGKVYQRENWQYIPVDLSTIPGLAVEYKVEGTESNETYSVDVTYTPAENYRVCASVVDEESTTYEENNQAFADTFESRDANEKHHYVLSVRLNSFKVSVDPEANITVTPADGIVSYNRSATVTVEAPEGQYLTGLQVNGESVTVDYSGDLPAYTLTNIREDKVVTATFESVENMPVLAKDDVLTVTSANAIDTPADAVKDQWQVIYLANTSNASVVIAGNGYLVSESITGPFTASIEIKETDEIGTLYVLKDGVISQVEANVKVVKDTVSPEITKMKSKKIMEGIIFKSVVGVKWTITVSDTAGNDISSGIDRVVYSTENYKNPSEILALTNVAVEDDGKYVAEIRGDGNAKYYFWVIDKAGNVSGFDNPGTSNEAVYIVDSTDPIIDSFTVTGRELVSYSDGNYAMPGITFQVKCHDALSDIESVVMSIGENSYPMTGKDGTYTVTVSEPVSGEVSVAVTDTYATTANAEGIEDGEDPVQPNTATKTLQDALTLSSNLLTVEKDAPSVSIAVSANSTNGWYRYIDDEGNPNAITFTIDIEDNGAGLSDKLAAYTISDKYTDNKLSSSIEVTYETKEVTTTNENGEEVTETVDTDKIIGVQLTVTVTGDAAKEISSSDLTLSIPDRAGNTTVVTSKEEASLAFMFDSSKPVIAKFDIPDSVTAIEPIPNTSSYTYFFAKDTTVQVWAEDFSSGVAAVYFYKTPAGGEAEEATKAEDLTYDEATHRYHATYTVEANFKGTIHAYAVDTVANIGDTSTPNGMIVETQEHHDSEATHITLTRPNEENPILDKDGVPVYTTLVYDENGDLVTDETTGKPLTGTIPVNVVIEDAYNGIHSFTYTVTAPHDDADDLTGTVTLFNEKGTPLYEDGKIIDNGIVWTIEEMDQNLVTKVSGDINISYNSNSIVVDVDMADMANNVTMDVQTKLSIDNTLPTIEVSHIIPAAAESANTAVPTEGTVTAKTGDTPYYVGYKNITADGEDAATYPIYPGSTLLVKITERNLSESTAQELAQTALKLLDGKSEDAKTEEVDLESELKFFGPFRDEVKDTGEVDADGNPIKKITRVDATGIFDDNVYYLVELRNCNEEARGGTYQTNFLATDLTGHKAELPENFVIDDTAPAISITFDNNDVENGKYYDAERTATITVVERNFTEGIATIEGTASDDGTPFNFPTGSAWTTAEDNVTHVATVSFTADGRYQDFTVTATDLANHTASLEEEEFYVDTTLPEIVIEGVEDQSAYNDVVAPTITYTDTNIDLDSVEIVITGANNGEVVYTYAKTNVRNGETVQYEDFLREKQVDDIYTLYVHLVDKAGNEQTEVIQFSCNRFGSVFDLSTIQDILGKYNQQEKDIVVTETNVDPIDLDTARITLIKNGVPVDLVKDQDFSLKSVGGEGSWSQYTYTIFSELFADDGTYSLYFYTVDAAGNVNENIDEAKDAQISFGIDKTKPIATPIDFVSDTQYAVDSKTVSVEIKDNLLLEDVKIYLNGTEVPYVVDGDDYIFEVQKSNSKQNVRIVAVDAAGNEEEILVTDVLITTNIFARWYNNTPLFIGSLVLLAALLGIGGWRLWLILAAKRNRDEEEV